MFQNMLTALLNWFYICICQLSKRWWPFPGVYQNVWGLTAAGKSKLWTIISQNIHVMSINMRQVQKNCAKKVQNMLKTAVFSDWQSHPGNGEQAQCHKRISFAWNFIFLSNLITIQHAKVIQGAFIFHDERSRENPPWKWHGLCKKFPKMEKPCVVISEAPL